MTPAEHVTYLRPTGPRDPDLPPIGGTVHADFEGVALRFTRLFRGRDTGGAALAVRHRGETVVDIWGGYRDLDAGTPWQRDTMAMSFSTTKGVAATVIHRLADRGLLDYDDPVAAHWTGFAGDGRDRITVRQLLSHQAGLHDCRGLVSDPEELLDHDRMIELVAKQHPSPPPGTVSGYHGLTFGWLLAGLARAVTGEDMRSLFVRELAEPLDLDGLHLGCPPDRRERVARLFPETPAVLRRTVASRLVQRVALTRPFAESLLVDGFDRLWFEEEQRILGAQMPAVNGVFTARALATLYAALAGRGAVDGVRFLSAETVHRAGKVQGRDRDRVLNIPMRWRLGYHQAFNLGRQQPKAFGHYGYGGSGAWADPETGISVGFVTNRLWSSTTPIGDTRLVRLNAAILAAAHRR
jgi:CubicO group peptidase (beta-lactamase class C family)